MRADETITGLARGVAFQIAEAMGVIPRRQIADDVKQLGQDERAQLRKHGVRFGQHHVFMPALLKPAPTRLRLILWSLWEGFETIPEAPPPGLVTIPAVEGAPKGYYEKVGYRLCGPRALRIDMLERLADLIRPMDAKAGFEATADMLSITGCTLEQFAELMQGLGYEAERGERPRPPRPARLEVDGEAAAANGAAAVEPGAGSEASTTAEAGNGVTDTTDATELAAEPAEDATHGDGGSGEAVAATQSDDAPVEEAVADAPAADAPTEPGENVVLADRSAEPETEVYYVFRLRQRRGAAPGARQGKAGDKAGRRSRRAKDKAARGEKGDGVAKKKPDAGRKPPRQPREEKPVDPDSPFAVLKELKLK